MDDFVGRERELNDALHLLWTNADGAVLDLVGMHGVGKSRFIRELIARVRQRGDAGIRSVDLARLGIGIGHRGDYGGAASSAMLRETLAQSRQLMRRFVEEPTAAGAAGGRTGGGELPGVARFRLVSESAGRADDVALVRHAVQSGRDTHLRDVSFTTEFHLGDDAFRQHLQEAQRRVDDAFVEAWEEFTARRRMLITVDSFELIADDEIGQWLIRTALQLPNTLVVVARVPAREAHVPVVDGLVRCELPHFHRDEVHECLVRTLHSTDFPPVLADVVHQYTDGHPGGVALSANLILQSPARLDELTLRRTLARLPSEPDRKWAELVRIILQVVDRRGLRDAVQAAAVVTAFNEPLLAELLDVVPADRHRVGEIIEALADYRLVQPVLTSSGERSNYLRLPEFIRIAVNREVRTTFTGLWQQLHRRAAEHYRRLLDAVEDGVSGGEYGAWYRYEKPTWQMYKSAWLYHSGQLTGPHDRELTCTVFATVFFEAMWWWADYYPFGFSRRLVEDWERITAGWEAVDPSGDDTDPERELADALGFLLDHYPLGHLKPASARWDEITDRLLLIRDLCGLNRAGPPGRTPDEDSPRTRLRGLTGIFLAHAVRYQDPRNPRADRRYREALADLEPCGDAWTAAWLYLERADLAVEGDRFDDALELLGIAARRARDLGVAEREWDHELLACLHRVRADLHWSSGELLAAAERHGSAVADAYWLQGEPHPPDGYTRQFYSEMTTRAGQRVLELAQRGPVEVPLDFVARLREPVPGAPPIDNLAVISAVRSGSVADLAAALFPAPPSEAELSAPRSSFMERWRRARMDADSPPDTLGPLLPPS